MLLHKYMYVQLNVSFYMYFIFNQTEDKQRVDTKKAHMKERESILWGWMLANLHVSYFTIMNTLVHIYSDKNVNHLSFYCVRYFLMHFRGYQGI